MTTGRFHSIEISSIRINRDERQRREITSVDSLADSIKRLGLIHPIIIGPENILVAGERRLTACRSLGWTHILCQHADELDSSDLRAIELEENIKRQDVPWQDQCLAVRELHLLRKSEDPSWTAEKTGDFIGLNRDTITAQIRVANEIVKGNQKILDAPKYSTARGIIERTEERKKAAALEEFHSIDAPAEAESVICIDFAKWAETYSGPRFNLIHCDFPYGINADKHVQGAARLHGGYDDSEANYWNLLHVLTSSTSRICSDSCHILFWFSMRHYHTSLDFFARFSDFIVDPFPLIWIKSDNTGIIPDPERGPRRIYETALLGHRGDRKIISPVSNAISAPTDKTFHMSVKPEGVLRHFFRMLVDENTVMLDPTCGSGSSLRAAEGLGAKSVLGLEINEEFAGIAKMELSKARRTRP